MPKGFRKCSECGDLTPTDTVKIISGKAYCPRCAQARLKEVEDNNNLRDYLYNLCGQQQTLMPFLMTQVKRLKTDHEFKISGILATLQYIFETSENPPVFMEEYGIEGLVIRNYNRAKKYYEQVRELAKFPEIEIDEILSLPTTEIHLSRDVIESKNRAYINKIKDLEYGPVIDLNSIEDEEDMDEEV